jgi:hypothetical protein
MQMESSGSSIRAWQRRQGLTPTWTPHSRERSTRLRDPVYETPLEVRFTPIDPGAFSMSDLDDFRGSKDAFFRDGHEPPLALEQRRRDLAGLSYFLRIWLCASW